MEFECLVERIAPKLKAIAYKLNGRFTFFDSDDLFQEALIHLWRNYQAEGLTDKTESYILQGCFFFLKNYIRVYYKKIDMQSVSLNDIAGKNDEDVELFEEQLISEDQGKQFGFVLVDILVEDMVQCLTARERDVFLLLLEELTTREIGEKLGISHAMVVKFGKRIRAKCKTMREEMAGKNAGLPKV